MIENAIILSAGYSKRLRPLSFLIPKSLIKIRGEPIIFHIMKILQAHGVKRFYINLYYKKEKIERFLKSLPFRKRIFLVREEVLMGTGGGIKNFERYIKGDFFVHNCDIYHNLNLTPFIEFHLSHRKTATLLLSEIHSSTEFVVKGNEAVEIRRLPKKRKVFTYSGIAIFRKKLFDYLPSGRSDLIHTLNRLIEESELKVFVLKDVEIVDIGTYTSLFKVMLKNLF